MAAARAEIHPKVAQEISRHCLKKGIWAKLLPPGKASLAAPAWFACGRGAGPEEHYRTHPLWEVVARSLLYRETWRRRISRVQHINASKLTAYVLEERRIASRGSCRFLTGMDSQVSLGAVVKGRSASRSMPDAISGGRL